jgi:L-rhamnose isomerase
MKNINKSYELAKEYYAQSEIDTDKAIKVALSVPISVHCWQLDDLTGFENFDMKLSGGIEATGNAAGKPKNKEEYMNNLDQALSFIPGSTKLALHAVYLDNHGQNIDRNQILPEHFSGWVDYAKKRKIGLDFNPTYFSHPLFESGFTLSSSDNGIRDFWIEHGKRCRDIGEYFGKELGTPCVTNHWIPDGFKDITVDKLAPRLRLADSLDQILAKKIDKVYNIDSLESKLFGLGSESYVVGSHEFYSNYVFNRQNSIVCMDAGHFHPTEDISSKISSYIAFNQELMLHLSRPVRWDSDHVVIVDDALQNIMEEVVRCNALDKVHLGLDFFDASINRVAATVIGARNARKALLKALLEPTDQLKKLEMEGNLTKRLALLEEIKTFPYGAVWDQLCEIDDVPDGRWIDKL